MTRARAALAASTLLAIAAAAGADEAGPGATITAAQADGVATRRTVPDLAEEAPGVVDVDGAGNPQIRGGTLTMNRWFVDGFEATDAVTGTFALQVPFAAVDAVAVRTGALDTQEQALGGAIDVVTVDGGERLRLDGALFVGVFTSRPFAVDATARPLAQRATLAPFDEQASVVASGPIVARRLWASAAVEYDHAAAYDAVLAHLKLTWAPTARQRVTLLALADPVLAADGPSQGGALAGLRWERAGERLDARVQAAATYEALPGDRRWGAQLDPSLTLRGRAAGTHEATAGVQARFAWHALDADGGRSFVSAGGQYRRLDAAPTANQQWGGNVALFVEDRWRPWARLLLTPGLRVDYGVTRNSVGETVSSLWGVGPRLGARWDATGDGRTIASFFYGRSTQTMSLLPAARADVTGAVAVSQYNGADGRFEPVYTIGGADGYRIDPHASAPHADEIDVALARLLFDHAWGSIGYTYKRIGNVWDGVEVNQLWNAAGTGVVGTVDGQPHQVFQITTPDGNYRIYQGVDVVLAWRAAGAELWAAYTLSWLYGPGAEELGQIGGGEAGHSPFYNPRQTPFFDGFLPEDQRHVVKLRASYRWRGLLVGAWLRWATGAPLARRYYSPWDGADTLRRGPQDELRLSDQFDVDLRAGWEHRLGPGRVQVLADLFNLFDLDGAPFRIQLGLRYTY